PRGWSKLGPIKTESRIDVPSRPDIEAGPQTIAGGGWGPAPGLDRGGGRVGPGPGQGGRPPPPLGARPWRQRVLRWHPKPGTHAISVRATDGTGYTQTAERSDPPPNGATGYHSILVTAR